ncbi:PAS domain S-box protein [Desulfospira joergensenii]|uniref:sensor histidine kinase n=1 Tax=Desulfospira joergensenii TaxID=53329 RepID=UPI0003B6F61D|nr:PAS domain S-box protein [Desulfospira joergensenii]
MDLQNKSVSAILNNLSDAFMIIGKGGRVEFLNAQAQRITGYTNKDAGKMNCSQVFKSPGCNECCYFNPEMAKKTCSRREMIITRKDGKLHPVECTTSTILGTDGMVTGAVDVFKDISKIKLLEDDLRHSENKYRHLFESTKDMIFIISKKGRFLDLNQALVDLLGYREKKELYALENIEEIFIDSIHWKVFQKQMILNGYVKDFEAGFKTKDGSRLHCNLSANTIRDGQGKILGYEGIAKDITARMDAFRALYKNHQELVLLNTIAVTMNSTNDLKAMLSTALNEVMKLLNFSIGAIFLINHEKHTFDLNAYKGFSSRMYKGPVDLTFHDLELMEFLLGKDNFLTPKSIFPSFKVSLCNSKTRKAITMTCFLITEKEKPSGFMAFRIRDEEALAIEDFHLLGSLGNFVGGAIANINLIKTVEKHREELKEITARLFHSQEVECKRISRELHDETGSALIGINLKLDAVENKLPDEADEIKSLLRHVKGQINHTYLEMRRISHRLHPALLSDLGLEPALDQYISEISEQSRLKITFKMIGFSGRINPDIETVLYRFSQEALSNAMKYARARSFKLSIIKGYPSIIFIADDDGIGFDLELEHQERPALGLLSMRERATLLGGKFSLRTAPGKGTRIRIEIPINQEKAAECLPMDVQEMYEQ